MTPNMKRALRIWHESGEATPGATDDEIAEEVIWLGQALRFERHPLRFTSDDLVVLLSILGVTLFVASVLIEDYYPYSLRTLIAGFVCWLAAALIKVVTR